MPLNKIYGISVLHRIWNPYACICKYTYACICKYTYMTERAHIFNTVCALPWLKSSASEYSSKYLSVITSSFCFRTPCSRACNFHRGRNVDAVGQWALLSRVLLRWSSAVNTEPLMTGGELSISGLAWIPARKERKGSLYVDIWRAGINMLVDT